MKKHRTLAEDVTTWSLFVQKHNDPVDVLCKRMGLEREEVKRKLFAFVFGNAKLPDEVVEAIERKS